MIQHIIDLIKLISGVAAGTIIGSYIMEWRLKKLIKKYEPLIMMLIGGKQDELQRNMGSPKKKAKQ